MAIVTQLLQDSDSYPELRNENGQYYTSNFCANCQKQFLWLRRWMPSTIGRNASWGYCFTYDLRADCPSCAFGFHSLLYATWTQRGLGPVSLECRGSVVGLYTGGYASALGGNLIAAITPPKDPGSEFIYGRRLRDTAEFPLLKSWVLQCCSNHRTCSLRKRPFLATHFRVIDCQTRAFVLFDTKEHSDFATLSYVWGKPKEQGLEKDGKRLVDFGAWRSEGGLPTVVPKVIQDAMAVVTNLGYRYLWVDRYCIPQGQDNDSIQVRTEMIAVMGAIYATSALTIIQASGDGPEDGLAGVSANSRFVQPAIDLDGYRSIVGIGTPAFNIQCSKWNTRGWTFQEGALSRRRLVFTHCQAYFQCQEMQCTESLSAKVPFNDRILNTAIFPPYHPEGQTNLLLEEHPLWVDKQIPEAHNFIEQYAGRKFTYDGDAYDAFRGIVALFKSRNPPLYFFKGLPLISPISRTNRQTAHPQGNEGQAGVAEPGEDLMKLAFALSWRFEASIRGVSIDTRLRVRRIQFPSWTWLGWQDCPRNCNFRSFSDLRNGETVSTCYLESAEVQYADGTIDQWDADWRRICVESETKQIDALKIEGWTFELGKGHNFSELVKDDIRKRFGDLETHSCNCLLLASSHEIADGPSDEVRDELLEKLPGSPYANDFSTVFFFLILTSSPSRPGWYERLDYSVVSFFSRNFDINFGKLQARRTKIFLS